MDPHITKEDYDNLYLEPLTHRHLKQTLSPPIVPSKKKKLVNFKISRRRRSIEDHAAIRYRHLPGMKSNSRASPIREDVEETRLRNDEDVTNFNINNTVGRRESSFSTSTTETLLTPEANGNIPSQWPQPIPENQRPNLNQMTSILRNPKTPESVPLSTRIASATSPWEKVKERSSNESIRRNSLFSVVNNVVSKKKATPAPSIWTPAVPRSQPTPRPGNWKDQEEPGKGSYMFTFISNSLLAKTKQQLKQMKYHNSPYYQESQSPTQRRKQFEFYNKQYNQWLTDILAKRRFQEGYLMKALEVGVQFPVVHCCPVDSNANQKDLLDPTSPSRDRLDPTSPSRGRLDPTSPSRGHSDPASPSRHLKDPTSPSRRLKDPTSPSRTRFDPTSSSRGRFDPTSPSRRRLDPTSPSRCRSDPTSPSKDPGLGPDSILSQGIYEEVVTWVPELLVTCPSDPSQWARCYILIAYKTLDGELSLVEDQWKEWTGALHVYFNISDDLHLKRLSFYRRTSRHHTSLFTYIVVIEVDTVTKENCLYLLDFVYRMRLKGMGGYISAYQEHSPSSSSSPTGSSTSSSSSSSSSSSLKGRDDNNQVESPSKSFVSSILDVKKINI